jgi:NADPH-dependent 2,4-dienoyl-CoA reductase/sulfur reductase-like enzyme/rhodanese-related sulfurtransferase
VAANAASVGGTISADDASSIYRVLMTMLTNAPGSSHERRRVLVVGGVAGGASCAARLRRLDESLDITVFDRGPFVSFANCGLPYYVGNVIADERALLIASPELFRQRFNINVHTDTDVTAIDRDQQQLTVVDLGSGQQRSVPYDALVLAPGAAPIRPPVPGVDLPGVFAVRTIPDSRHIRSWIVDRHATHAVVVGGGFIGLEMVENLVHRGLQVTVVEKLAQLMSQLDPEMAAPIKAHLLARGVSLNLSDGLAAIERSDDGRLDVVTDSGIRLQSDLVVLAIGVRPETHLARTAGLAIGSRGGIVVDEQMRSSDPAIWAVGDAVEVPDVISGQETVLPLAGPANRQGRVAAESIAGRPTRFRGVQATSVVGVLGITIASTGASEKGLRRARVSQFDRVYLHPGHHAGYYPGAQPIHMKLLFSTRDGGVLGAQAVGCEGVEKRIDVIAMAIQMGATVHDLAEAELCYAPQFGAAKDPVNVAGMLAENVLNGDMPVVRWEDLKPDGALLLDVRDPAEFAAGHIAGAVNIPLSELRSRYPELENAREIWVTCGVGQRAYYATRFLRQHGFRAANLSGGYSTYRAFCDARGTSSDGQ